MGALLLALGLAASAAAPGHPGTFRRALRTDDGTHVAAFLYVPERGAPDDPLVVLLPDLGATHGFFDVRGQGLARELVRRGHLVATLDWRGTGMSETPAVPPGLEDLLTQDLRALADVAGAQRPLVLVGWGYAGALAYAAAAQGPLKSRVRGVVSLDGVVALDVPNPAVKRLLQPGGPLDLPLRLAQPAPESPGDLFELLWLHGSALDPALGDVLREHALAPLSGREVSELAAWIHTGELTLGGAYPAELDQIEAPVLLLLGPLDDWTHPEFAEPIRDHLPQARVEAHRVDPFSGFGASVGHVGLVLGPTASRELVPLIDAFLRRCRTPLEVRR